MTKDLLIIPSFTLLMSVMSFSVPATQVVEQSPSTGESAAAAVTNSPVASTPISATGDAKPERVVADTLPEAVAPSPVVGRAAFSPCDKALATRVEARWQAMIDKDFAKAYQFTLPSYRETNSLDQFKGRFGEAVTWRAAKVVSLQYSGTETVRLSIELEVEYVPSWGGDKQTALTQVDETWLSREGSWWLSLSR